MKRFSVKNLSLFASLSILFFAAFSSSYAAPKKAKSRVVNLLTDCSHEYSFNLSHANRNQEMYPGINCLTSCKTISKLDLKNINALVLLLSSRLPYLKNDAEHILDYVKNGGGLYITVKDNKEYSKSLNEFLKPFGLKTGSFASKNPADWGISAHAPSNMIFDLKGKYKTFLATVGNWADYSCTVGFEIYGDGKQLYKSKVLTGAKREKIKINISGIKKLRLVTNDGGDGKSRDGSVWYNPRMIDDNGENVRLLLKNASSVKVGWSKAAQDQHFNGQPLSCKTKNEANALNTLSPNSSSPAALKNITLSAGNGSYLTPQNGSKWKTVYSKKGVGPVVIERKIGKGTVIADMSGIYYGANSQSEPHIKAMTKMIKYIARTKKVTPVKGGGGWQFSDGYRWDLMHDTPDGLRIHYNEYTKMFIKNDIKAYHAALKYLKQVSGIDVHQKAAQIKELNDMKAASYLGVDVNVNLKGIKKLTLLTTDGGNGNVADHTIWANAYLTDLNGKKHKLLLKNATIVKPGYEEAIQDKHGSNPINIGGKVFKEGIFIHAPGKLVFNIDGKYKTFTAHAGCQTTSPGSVGFKVVGDGKTLWQTEELVFGGIPGGNPKDVNFLPPGKLFQIKYLACQGAGFLLPQGAAVDLAPGLKDDWQVHLGMFSHEMGHAWGFPFCEKIGEEASAFTFNNLVLDAHNNQHHNDFVTRRLQSYLKRDGHEKVDFAKERSDFKYYFFIDLMLREYGLDVWKNYNLLKYAILNKKGAKWNAASTAWLWSVATGEDQFITFNTAFDSTIKRSNVQLPEKLINAGFDTLKVGKLYNIPLKKLTPKRHFLKKLKNFKDVEEFYKKEIKKKGSPKVEG